MIEKRMDYLLRFYWKWPLYTIIVMIIITTVSFIFDYRAGVFSIFVTIIFGVLLYLLQLTAKNGVFSAMSEYAMQMDTMNSKICKDIDIPITFVNEIGYILWSNDKMDEILSLGNVFKATNISSIFPEITKSYLSKFDDEIELRQQYKSRDYFIKIIKGTLSKNNVFGIYLYDETETLKLRADLIEEKLAVGLIYMDNYEEAIESTDEVKRALLPALIERRIEGYINSLAGIIKKLEKDKYFFIIRRAALEKLEEGRFNILEDIKTIDIGNRVRVTMSIGIGLLGDTYQQDYDYARMAMDAAIGRGGDQAVVREAEASRFYGGKSQTVERSTRVKARVKAQTLRDLMLTRSNVIIMGHRNMDIDCFGSAIGIWRVADSLGKRASIVRGDVGNSLKLVFSKFKDGYPKDLFVNKEDVEEIIDDKTMLVVVDVNRPSITEFPDLLKQVKTIVVLDHHRQSSEIIENATFSYVEPYASSACEMVSEIVQYIIDDVSLSPAEADAMYAGIVVDTQNFTIQTGVRTFEAAAFLRRKGADVVRVRKMFREDLASYKAKIEAVHNVEIIDKAYAFSICLAEGLESPTVTCAKAANELLNIEGVKASFVLTQYKGKVYLSARSIDEVNVQVIVEKLGGGGHRNVAGAQFDNKSIEATLEDIKNVVIDMKKKGEI